MDTLPSAPPAPTVPSSPPKHTAHWKIVMWTAVIEFVALAVLGGVTNIGEEPAPIPVPSVAAELPIPSESGITAADVVNATDPAKILEFCNAYAIVGDSGAAREAFASGWTEPDPSADEVFDELVTRC